MPEKTVDHQATNSAPLAFTIVLVPSSVHTTQLDGLSAGEPPGWVVPSMVGAPGNRAGSPVVGAMVLAARRGY